jgi:hypothetical protein
MTTGRMSWMMIRISGTEGGVHKYTLRLLVSSTAVLGVEAEAQTKLVVEAGVGFDKEGDELHNY